MSPCPQGTIPYKVKPGDTFYNLAHRYNTTVQAIVGANPGINSDNLRVGQSLCIPVRRNIVPCAPGNRYVIKPGDSFSRLARRYGISVNTILEMNQGVDPSNLQAGQVICLPVRRRRVR